MANVSVEVTIRFQAENLIDEESLLNFGGPGNAITVTDLVRLFEAERDLWDILNTDRGSYEIVKVERVKA